MTDKTEYVTTDSGERQNFTSGMIRDSGGEKPRYDLINPLNWTPNMVDRWAALMARGAAKYTTKIDITDPRKILSLITEELIWEVAEHIRIDLFTLKDTADPVTKNDYVQITQSLPNVNVEIESLGEIETRKKSLNSKKSDYLIPDVELEINEQNDLPSFVSEVLQKKPIKCYWKNKTINVLYAEKCYAQAPVILIMTMKPDLHEDIYVMGATGVWECLATLLKVCKKLLPTLRRYQLGNSLTGNSQLIIQGVRNWEQADSIEELNRFVASADRHFNQWKHQILSDLEDGEDHAAAIFFNIQGAEYTKFRLDTN